MECIRYHPSLVLLAIAELYENVMLYILDHLTLVQLAIAELRELVILYILDHPSLVRLAIAELYEHVMLYILDHPSLVHLAIAGPSAEASTRAAVCTTDVKHSTGAEPQHDLVTCEHPLLAAVSGLVLVQDNASTFK